MVSVASVREFLTQVYTEFSEKNVTFMAGGIAYSAFISLAPLLILLFLLLTIIGGGLEARIIELSNQHLPGAIADVVEQVFQEDGGAGGASIIGLVVLIWGALKIFRGLDTAFSEIYETTAKSSFVNKLTDGLTVLFALGIAVVATVGAGAVVALFADVIPVIEYLMPLVLLGGLFVAFLPMYYLFPDCDLGLRDVVPGALFAAVGWAAFQSLFQVYLTFSDPGAGSFAGGVIVVITYLYFTALVLLLGAVINAVAGDHSSGEPGGLGGGASPDQIRREDSLDGAELDAYLRTLDERITARYDTDMSDYDALPQPEGNVDLVEYETATDGDRQWTVELSWTPEADSIPDQPEESATQQGGG